MHNITLISGDGIGIDIMDSMKKVVKASGVDINWIEVEAGEVAIKKYSTPLPDEVIESIKKTKVAIKGPITTPVGKGFRSVNVRLRKELDLYANVRPIKSIDGINSRYKDVDLVIIRENTEGLYSGIEHMVGEDAGETIKIITKKATGKIVNFACEYLKNNCRNRLTCVHKANIMKVTDGLFLKEYYHLCNNKNEFFKEGCSNEVSFDDMIVDACAMNMVLSPEKFDVMVMPNLYGDILSDLGAGLVGGLGMIPSGNIGDEYAVFEAVHGSAPDIAGKNLANPTAIIQSSIMMLRYIKEFDSAKKIEDALMKTLGEGIVLTRDLGGVSTTSEFTEEIVKNME